MPAVPLTIEEKEELEALEAEVNDEYAAAAVAAQRQHIDALKLRKHLAPKCGVPGDDFEVIESDHGNFAIRRPTEEQVQMLQEDTDDIERQKAFLLDSLIAPDEASAKVLLTKYPGLRDKLVVRAFRMVGRLREQEAKK